MQKNFILFIILVFIFTFIYFTFILPKLVPNYQTNTTNITKQNINEEIKDEKTQEQIQNVPEATTNQNIQQYSNIITNKYPENFITLENNNIFLTISTYGGKVIHYELKNFKSDKIKNNSMILEEKDESLNFNTFETSFISQKNLIKSEEIDFEIIDKNENSVTLKKIFLDANNNPTQILKQISLKENGISILFSIKGLNNTIPILNDSSTLNLISWGYTLGPSDVVENRNNRQEVSYYFGDTYRKLSLRDRKVEILNNFKWLSISNLYFTLIFQKNDTMKFDLMLTQISKNKHEVIIIPSKFELINNEYKLDIYLLPKNRTILSKIDPTFKNIVNYGGILNPIVLLFNFLLDFFYSFLKNYGVAIIFVSLLIKVLLYPLTRKSLISMKKMAQLSPKIQEIQNRNKNNPQKAQLELSELYKKEGVSPLSGCLPIFLQLPFLIAFYNSIIYNLNLRNSKFLWIKDLSSPDVIFSLSFSLPFIGNEIRLLPIIMIVVSIFQSIIQSKGQVYTSSEQKMQSQIMAYLMPILFFFLFYNFSSGLVLYWTTQNIFSIIENYITNINFNKSNKNQY